MYKIKIFAALVAALLLTGCNGTADKAKQSNAAAMHEKVLLRLNYPAGFKQELTYKMHTDVTGGDGGVDEEVVLTFETNPKPPKENPTFVFSGKVKQMKWHSDVFGEKESYDSSAKSNPGIDADMAAEYGAYMDKDFTFEVDRYGAIKQNFEFTNTDIQFEQLIDLNNYFTTFPEKEVGVGDTWKGGFKNAMTNQLVTRTYTVKEISKSNVTIEVVSVVPAFKGVTKESTYKGNYIIDRNTGMLVRGELKGTINGAVRAKITINLSGKKI
ncbi:MAG: DUF6263 family protein [Bacteroidota bacterium]